MDRCRANTLTPKGRKVGEPVDGFYQLQGNIDRQRETGLISRLYSVYSPPGFRFSAALSDATTKLTGRDRVSLKRVRKMKEDRYCVTCANWFPIKSSTPPEPGVLIATSGECHRYAPRPLLADPNAIKCRALFWPTTRPDDVCGEWYYGGLRAEVRASNEAQPESPAAEAGRGSTLKGNVVEAVPSTSPKRPS